MQEHCNTNSDCLGAWEVCNPDGICACPKLYGFVGEPECRQLTWDSAWAVGTSLLCAVVAAAFFVWTSHQLLKVLRVDRCDYMLSTTVACFISSSFGMSLWAIILAHALGSSHPRDAAQYELVTNALIVGNAGSLLCAAFNLSLMWAEFIIASKGLLATGTNLSFSARFLFWYMVVFSVASALATLLGTFWHQIVFTLWVLVSISSALVWIIVQSLYSLMLSIDLLKETGTAVAAAAERASEETSQADQQHQLSRRLVARGKNVIKTTGRLRVCGVLQVFLFVGYQAVLKTNARIDVQWLLLGGLAFSMFAITTTILSSINTTLPLIREQNEITVRPRLAHAGHSAPEVQVCVVPADLPGEVADFNAAILGTPSPLRMRSSAGSIAPTPSPLRMRSTDGSIAAEASNADAQLCA